MTLDACDTPSQPQTTSKVTRQSASKAVRQTDSISTRQPISMVRQAKSAESARLRLERLVTLGLAEGQDQLALTLRQLVYREEPAWFEQLDFNDDRVFLEPSLFAWFTGEREGMPLTQVLYGLLPESRRPHHFQVLTDAQGDAYLPGLGTLHCELASTVLEIRQESDGQYSAIYAGDRLPVQLQPEVRLSTHHLRMQDRLNPLFRRFFVPHEADLEQPQPHRATFLPAIRRTLELMSGLDRRLYLWITQATQIIQLYSARLPNSFASLSAHGMAFCNVNSESDLVFFADDLSHQCGHIIFNAVTREKARYLAADPQMPVAQLSGDVDEPRELYGAFHGLFTYTLVTRFLDRMLRSDILGPSQRHHARGRMEFYLRKFAQDLQVLGDQRLFEAPGWEFYQLFQRHFLDHKGRYGVSGQGFELDNQPYVFSRSLFFASNPMPAVEGVMV